MRIRQEFDLPNGYVIAEILGGLAIVPIMGLPLHLERANLVDTLKHHDDEMSDEDKVAIANRICEIGDLIRSNCWYARYVH